MADDYIDLVLCRNDSEERVLAKAPAWSYLKEGDWIVLENDDGEHKKAIVEKVLTTKLRGEEISFILRASQNSPLELKVRSKIKQEKFNYPEDAEEDTHE